MAKYIYGIINSENKKTFGNIGLCNGEIYSVQFEDVGAVVSDVLDDSKIGLEEAKIHDAALRKIMTPYAVIPMGFGLIAKDEEEIKNILKRGRIQLKKTLEKVDHKSQINIKISWDKAILTNILIEDAEIRKLAHHANQTTDQSFKIELGRKVKAALDQKKAQYLQAIDATLKSLSLDFEENKTVDQDMLMNAAFLIDKSREGEFCDALVKLEKEYAGKLTFLTVGPLPAYNFTKIGVKKFSFDALDAARKALGLSQEVSLFEVNSAYNSLARRYHPDLHPDDQSCEQMFRKIKAAHDLLVKYCEHYLCSLDKAEVEENILFEEKSSYF
jgi:hypothetical protein